MLARSDFTTIKVWNLSSGTLLATLGGGSQSTKEKGQEGKGITALLFSPDSQKLTGIDAVGSASKTWNLTTGHLETTFGPYGPGGWIASFSPGPHPLLLATADTSEKVKIWEVSTRKNLVTFPVGPQNESVSALALSPDGKTLAAATRGNLLGSWSIAEGKPLTSFKAHSYPVIALVFSRDGRILVSASQDNTVRLWETDSGRELSQTDPLQTYGVNALALSPDGKELITGQLDGSIKVWEMP